MDNALRAFYENEAVREAVREHLIEHLKGKIISRAFRKEDTKDLAEAKSVIETAFAELEGRYAKTIQKQDVR